MSLYEEWRASLNETDVRDALDAGVDELVHNGHAKRDALALLGFCFGGGRLMEEIARAPQGVAPKVAVAFYPTSMYIPE